MWTRFSIEIITRLMEKLVILECFENIRTTMTYMMSWIEDLDGFQNVWLVCLLKFDWHLKCRKLSFLNKMAAFIATTKPSETCRNKSIRWQLQPPELKLLHMWTWVESFDLVWQLTLLQFSLIYFTISVYLGKVSKIKKK